MSLFSNFVYSHNLPAEPAATKAMEYILGSQSARRKFVDMLNSIGINFIPGSALGEKRLDEGRPDLVIYDYENKIPRIIVENKFWASLTKYQPIKYINQLPDTKHSVVLFIVPEERKRSIWNELKIRCKDEGQDLVDESHDSPILWGRLGEYRKLAVTSWKYTLRNLESAGEETLKEIHQLRDLVDKLTTITFSPLQPYELENFKFAQRVINFRDLVDQIAINLESSGYKKVRRVYDHYSEYGVYLCLEEQLYFWIGVSFLAWVEKGTTPLWFNLDQSNCPVSVWQQVEMEFDEVKNIGGQKYLPIQLETSVELDAVVSEATENVKKIAGKLLKISDNKIDSL